MYVILFLCLFSFLKEHLVQNLAEEAVSHTKDFPLSEMNLFALLSLLFPFLSLPDIIIFSSCLSGALVSPLSSPQELVLGVVFFAKKYKGFGC